MIETSTKMIKIQKLIKDFDNGFQLTVPRLELSPGETIAILGKNGAGKTTLFQLLSGNLDATTGSILLGEERISPEHFKAKKKIGYLPQHTSLPHWVTPKDVLNYAANLYQLEASSQASQKSLKTWDCLSYENKPITLCSHGMQKRVGLALAQIHDPDVLILDEPFSGLDLNHIETLKRKITIRQENRKLTILSTHIIPFVSQLCQRVFIIDKGQIEEMSNWPHLTNDQRENLITTKILGSKHH